MKIRASKVDFFTDLTEEDLKGEILDRLEEASYPKIISNNECATNVGSETNLNDSSLSFLIKFKASNLSPSVINNGITGIQLPDNGVVNKKVNDNLSHFQSVNENHHDLTINDEDELNNLISEIRKISPHYHSFSLDEIRKYIKRTLDDPEWQSFYKKDKRWNKFKNKTLYTIFKTSHCEITHPAMTEYLKGTHDNINEDLKYLKKHDAITDHDQLKVLNKFFPKIFT